MYYWAGDRGEGGRKNDNNSARARWVPYYIHVHVKFLWVAKSVKRDVCIIIPDVIYQRSKFV